MNILIKLMSIVALVIAPFIAVGGSHESTAPAPTEITAPIAPTQEGLDNQPTPQSPDPGAIQPVTPAPPVPLDGTTPAPDVTPAPQR